MTVVTEMRAMMPEELVEESAIWTSKGDRVVESYF